METTKVLVEGIVQGVGFRPFIYRIATELGLNGYVRNLGNVVEIIIQGNEIKEFIKKLQNELPPIAKLTNIQTIRINKTDKEWENYTEFTIKESSDSFSGVSVIPPDIAICDNCLSEINDPENRRYRHPFNACTDCGPRFTVIENVPYDRDKTTMEDFPLCDECSEEYKNPLDRRYHAEASCCPTCGPSIQLYKNNIKEYEDGKTERIASLVKSEDPLKDTANLLDQGKIFAIKGIGGTHLVASVNSEDTIQELRERLGRKTQAFAVMSPDIETVKEYAIVSKEEEKTLLSKERPIVILKKSPDYQFAESVSPDLHNIGVMLPYAPLHHILFSETESQAYIMTSANIPGEPMMIENQDILENLNEIADYYLIHDRRILNRCDDSVVRYRSDELAFIRRSRGYTPAPYDLANKYTHLNKKFDDLNILALGPELDVTFTLLKKSKAYTSQHIGNTNKYKTYQFLKEAIKHMMKITKTESFDAIVCDLHPQFFTTTLAKELAEEYNCQLIQVQHHHAHGTALINDHIEELSNDYKDMIIIAADGVGYGEDGGAWGGEILYTNLKEYQRIGSLMPQKMPGGDLCTKYPARILSAILANNDSAYCPEEFTQEKVMELMKNNYLDFFQHKEMEIKSLFKQIDSNINVGISTSTGRVLDSISTAIGICGERNYEGEASMKLESYAYGLDLKNNQNTKKLCGFEDYPIIIKEYEGRLVLDTTAILRYIIKKIDDGEDLQEIAITGQKAISIGLAELAIKLAEEKGVKVIGATGGCFYNESITKYIKNYIEDKGYIFLQHTNSCPGDGSVSLGQAIVAGINYMDK